MKDLLHNFPALFLQIGKEINKNPKSFQKPENLALANELYLRPLLFRKGSEDER